ncbi:hypothetical protein GPX89_07620 [Nocardia sp. ET3-3]|uniref:OmpR/PhoB-type domain-containing protein n=1 Tax=Nocardia terrae TaxID=2675851 RepID=A0A7K1US02_9NOCA|nr:BTAD domain-containing putative transcriptional regulator [Nocardia terrae]MVU77115.1 hypothetical protein [Nocardia terrae]
MLIAIAGLHPSAGASTTALLLAAAWPTGQPVIVVEADPRGGKLARRCGGDPARGVASLTAAAGKSGVRGLGDLADHLQWHPVGVAYLAAPERPGNLAWLSAPSGFDLAGLARTGGPTGELVVVADCGLVSQDSSTAALFDGADVLLVVADQHRPASVLAAHTRELAARFPRMAIVLTGPRSIPATFSPELDAAVIGWLPPPAATGPTSNNGGADASEVGTYVRALAAAVCTRAAEDRSGCATDDQLRPRRRGPLRRPIRSAAPTVYAISARGSFAHSRSRLATASATPLPAVPALAGPLPQPAAVPETDFSPVPEPAHASGAPHTSEFAPAAQCLHVRLFGPLRVMWRPRQGIAGQAGSEAVTEVEITARLQPRSRELLVLLAIHPHGLTRAQLVDALWGPRPPARPGNAVCTTLARLRNTLADITGDTGQPLLDTSSGRLRLNPAAVHSDYAEFTNAAMRRRHSGDDDERRRACARVLELAASGPLAADLDVEFLDPIRESVRRDAIASVGILIRSHTGKDPSAALRLLESAIDIDPHNENFYRDMLRLYFELGEHYVIGNTVNLLTSRLAQIGEKPSKTIRALARQLDEKAS